MEGLHGDFHASITFHVNFQGCINSNICFFGWILGSWICCVDKKCVFLLGASFVISTGQMCFFPYNRRLNSLTWFGSIDKTWWEWKPRMSNTMLAVYILGSSYIYIYNICLLVISIYIYQFNIISKQLYIYLCFWPSREKNIWQKNRNFTPWKING